MQRLLIGSSNVARNYHEDKFKGYPPYKMIKCTKVEVFRAVMDDIKDEKEVIIAVIENFLCDSVRNTLAITSDQIDEAINSTLKEFIDIVSTAANKLPGTRFALAQPTLRPRDEWFMERYDGLCRTFVAGINSMNNENISKLDALSRLSQNFEDDQVHLTLESGATYVNCLLYNADSFFTAEIVNLEEGTSNKPDGRVGRKDKQGEGKEKSSSEGSVRNLDKKIGELNRDMFGRRFHDSLVMARLREDLDTVSNTNKEDKIIISGLSSKAPRPAGKEEVKVWLKEMVSEVLDSIEPGSSSEIIFVNQGRSNNKDIPLAEVRMRNRDMALKIRKNFALKKKSGHDFGRLYISNCVTLATRVRIEIMKAMTKKFKTDKEEMFVMGYVSRPVIHVKPRSANQRSMWLCFSDALVRYGSGLKEADLGEAYRKAGVSFRGQLEQNFVVLHDKPVYQ